MIQLRIFFQKVLEALKPKRTKLGTPHANQLPTDASLVRESENEIHLTVEIEVLQFSPLKDVKQSYVSGAKVRHACKAREYGKSLLQSRA